MFRVTCLTHLFLRHSLLHFLHLHPVRRLHFRSLILPQIRPLPPCKEGNALAAWLDNPLSQTRDQRDGDL